MRSVLTAALVLLPVLALAQAASDADHAAHHPPSASSPAPTAQAPAVKPSKAAPLTSPSNATMKSMRDMHAKIMAARTPDERQALMAGHMKAMQDGMAMMAEMKAEKRSMPPSAEAMGKRMDMMEMMMDREAARSSSSKP